MTLPGIGADWVLSPDQNHLYVTIPDKDVVAVIETRTRKLIETIAIGEGSRPGRILWQPESRRLRNWEKFGFSLGLRAEETDLDAKDIKTNYAFKRNYAGLFPSGSLDFNLNKKNTITAAYSYRIDRPHYGMKNPVRTFNEQLSYGVGNPEIRPQYTHNITLDYNYNQWLTLSGGLNKTKDFTFWYAYTPDSSKINVDTISNLRDRENYYLSWSVQKRIKWYSFQTYGLLMSVDIMENFSTGF